MSLQIRGEIVVAGNLVEDVLARPVERIEYGRTVWIESIEHHLGGNGSNTSYALATLGVPVRLRGAVGRDDAGQRVLDRLRGVGVNLDEIEYLDPATASTVVLVAPDASRSFLHAPGVSREVFSKPGEFVDAPGHFHLANIFSLPNLRRTGAETLANAVKRGWTTSLDTGHDTRGEWMKVLEPCLEHIGLLFANEGEVLAISELNDVRSSAQLLIERGVGAVVIKRGSKGCAVFRAGNELWAAGVAIEAIDTTGAGDGFVGGFLAALYRGESFDVAARMGNACGALSASRVGSVEGLRGYRETVEWMGLGV